MSTLEQIDHAVEVLGKDDLVLLHCCSTYPSQYAELNLRAIPALRERYGVPVGYSGHETGIASSVAAATLGACIVERHITLDRAMWGSDQAASLEPNGIMRRRPRHPARRDGDGRRREDGPSVGGPGHAEAAARRALSVGDQGRRDGCRRSPHGRHGLARRGRPRIEADRVRGHHGRLDGPESRPVVRLGLRARVDPAWTRSPRSSASPMCTAAARTRRPRSAISPTRHELELDEICFIGDDVNDVPAFADLRPGRRTGRRASQSPWPRPSLVTSRAGGAGRSGRSSTRSGGEAVRRPPLGRADDEAVRLRHASASPRQGVKHVFMVPGGGAMHLNESLGRRDDIEFVVHAARAGGRDRRRGVREGHQQPRRRHGDDRPRRHERRHRRRSAWLDSTPCLIISGQVKRADLKRDSGVRILGVQEIDIVSIVRSITKYAVTIMDPLTIRYHLEKALHLAHAGPAGSRLARHSRSTCRRPRSIPADSRGFIAAGRSSRRRPRGRQVDRALELLEPAERPVILVGNGVRLAGAVAEFLRGDRDAARSRS